jgi:ParB family transcriptional regulator, chromosome partitioning protein
VSIYDKLGAKTAGIKARAVEKPIDKPPKTAPGMFLDAAQRMDAAEAKAEALEAELTVLKNRKIKLVDLHEVPGRRRFLTLEEFNELKANLANNPMLHAIVVRPRQEGGYEIIAGHNRAQAYRELGREEIEADIRDLDDEKVYEASFYSNLFNSPLSDYEKFQGFKRIQTETGESQSQLATKAGVSETKISYLFAFDKLSKEVLSAIAQFPQAIGAKAASKLTEVPVDQALAILGKLAQGEITQKEAVSIAHAKTKPAAEHAKPIIIKQGKTKFAEIANRRGQLVIKLRDEDLASNVMLQIEALLRELAK